LEKTLVAAEGRVRITPEPYPQTGVWCFDGSVPGPEIRLRQGERLQVTAENRLSQDTTVHWHGVRVPNAMDGAPYVTQPPIHPEESFTYQFIVPDAGTYWYHPHAHSAEQVGRGLMGVLIVEEPQPLQVDRDVVWVLGDFRLNNDASIAGAF
jgi:FtsP/CotA-like multicopper oxidase with cupredoxin domain